jgi:hypothetical protein
MKKSLLPKSASGIWDGTTLDLPLDYTNWYRKCVRALDRVGDARSKPPKGIIGGTHARDAEDHFVYRFPNSGGRACFAFLDPRGELTEASLPLQAAMIDGRIVLVDIPAGAGAFSLGIVSTLVHLRESGVLPRLPLHVAVVAGDISERALELAARGAAAICQRASQVGITLDFRVSRWDAANPEDWARLIDNAFAFADADSCVLSVLDFAGALRDTSFRDAFCQALKSMLGRFYGGQSQAFLVWLEPTTSESSRLSSVLNAAVARVRSWLGSDLTQRAKFMLRHPETGAVFLTDVELRRAWKE